MSLKEIEGQVHIYISSPSYKLFGALYKENITGFLAVSIRNLFVIPTSKMTIEGLIVDQMCRRKSVATQLMKIAEQYVKNKAVPLLI
jgi:hypothetical protein